MIRYQIRNEYGLSDPELYAAPGEEDDPEALLEGVAMAGLVGVLRQLGDLAEFAAEIFHDLHEDVMATASRGHGLMLRLQQLEAEFPAAEKAIISQTDHSNYPHDEGVEWHPNLQFKQNMITQGDMPRFILDSYEECRGPPHLFTLDKFDVAGAGASLKRYSDPSFFKTEHASNMMESYIIMEKKPRRIKKKAMRWRKGVTLEALLIANSESQPTSKDRASRKVPPRTTKLKSRHPQSPDYKTVSRICREHLQEVISSQQNIMSSCSARHYYGKFRSTDSSEMESPLGELNNFGPLQSSGKLELSKVVPINESDTVDVTSAPTNASGYLEADDKQCLGKQHGLTEFKKVSKKSPVEQNGMICDSEKLQDCPDLVVGENNQRLQSSRASKLLFAASHADQDADGCRSDDIASDDNFVGSLNSMDTEGVINPEMKAGRDPTATVEGNELNLRSKEGENALDTKFMEVAPTIESSPGLNVSCNIEEPTSLDLPLISDSVPSTVSTTNGPNSGSPSGRQLNGVNWTNDEEPFNDEDLMDVSSSSSVVSDSADLQTIDDSVGRQQHQDGAYESLDVAFVHSFDEQSPKTSSGLDGSSISSNSVNHGQNSLLDGSSMSMGGPNHVIEDEEEINVGDAGDFFLHPTKSNNEELQELKKELEEVESLDTGTSLGTLAALPDNDHIMCMNDVDMDNVGVPDDSVVEPIPAGLDPDGIHGHLDGMAPAHPNIRNNLLYESNDDEVIEDVRCLPDDDLSTSFNKHDTDDQQVVVLDEGTCSARLGTQKEDSVQSSAVAKDFACAQELPRVIQVESPSQDDREVYKEETPAFSSCVVNDDTEPLNTGPCVEHYELTKMEDTPECGESPSQDDREVYKEETPASSSCVVNDDTEPLNTGPCVEHHELTKMEDTPECGEIVVTEESTTSRFVDGVIPPEEITDAAKYSDKAEVLSTEEGCRPVVQFQSSSPFSEELETVEATCRNPGALESREHISKISMLQTNNIPFNELEATGGKCSDNDAVHLPSSAHFPEESDCEEQLLEEASLNAEVLSGCNSSDKDGAVSLKNNAMERQPANDQDLVWGMATQDCISNTVKKQPADADQDLAWNLSAQDSSSTNPFIDPAYLTSHAQIYPSTMSYQSCFSEEQDFLSELLIEHDDMGAASDSFWEPATPPDEAPLPSEVMTEEDFRSFCHEYHEINFKGGTDDCHGESASDFNNISNAVVVSESDWDCSVAAQPVKLDQEAFNGSNFSSQHAEYSSAMDAHADTSIPFSVKKDLEDETPEVDSHLKSQDSFSNNRSPELDMFSVPVGLQQEQHILLDKEKTNEECCSCSRDDVALKEELENRARLFPHSFVNENVDGLDVPPSNAMPVEPAAGAHVLDEHNSKDVPNFLSNEFDSPIDPPSSIDEDKDSPEASVLTSFQAEQDSECFPPRENDSQIASSSSLNENIVELEGHPLSNAVVRDQETEVCVPRGLDSRIIPCSSTDEKIYGHDCAPLSSSECSPSGEHDSQIALSSLLNKKIVELEGHPLSSAVVSDQEPEVCVPHGLDSRIIPCSSTDEKIYGHDCAPLSSSVLVDLDSEDHVLGDRDSQVTPCSLVKDKIDESEAAQQNIVLSEEQEQDARASPVLDSQFAPFSFNIDNAGEIDGPPPYNAQVKSEKEPYCPAEFDSETAPCSSISDVLADRTTLTPITPSNEKTCQLSLDPPSTISFQNGSYEDPQKPPPLPPLQWRLGRPRLGLLNTQGCIPESARRADPILPASSQEIDIRLGLLDQTNRSLEPVSPEGIKDMIKSSVIDGNERDVEFGRLSPSVTESGIARPLSEASENIKQQEHMSSSTIGLEEHPDDNTGVISKTGIEEHLDDSGVTHGTDLYPTNPLLSFSTYEQQDPHLHILSSDTSEKSEHPSHTHPAASEDDRLVNDHNAAVDMVSTSKQGHIYGSRCYQQTEHPESSSENLEHSGSIPSASEDGNIVNYQYITSDAPSDTSNHSAPDSLLEEENYQERQTLQERNSESSEDSQLRGSLPIAESMATQDCPNYRHNLEREKINRLSGPGPVVSGLDEGSYMHAEQLPVMGWTVGPQMLHPNYGTSIKERPFEPNITDNHLIRKPISIRNIPRNPLVDAVAAHDRSSMRKVSELAPPTDKPKPNERNLLLEQIRNKTFNLKPPRSPMPTAIRSPARADTRNLKVAAIIEKANAIRQAVGSDDEDGDNWSD